MPYDSWEFVMAQTLMPKWKYHQKSSYDTTQWTVFLWKTIDKILYFDHLFAHFYWNLVSVILFPSILPNEVYEKAFRKWKRIPCLFPNAFIFFSLDWRTYDAMIKLFEKCFNQVRKKDHTRKSMAGWEIFEK